MFLNSGAQSVDLLVRSVVAHAENGETFELTPHIALPANHSALGILGALSLRDIGLRQFLRRDGRWRYILIICVYLDLLYIA